LQRAAEADLALKRFQQALLLCLGCRDATAPLAERVRGEMKAPKGWVRVIRAGIGRCLLLELYEYVFDFIGVQPRTQEMGGRQGAAHGGGAGAEQGRKGGPP
jgi:hypothetical protein